LFISSSLSLASCDLSQWIPGRTNRSDVCRCGSFHPISVRDSYYLRTQLGGNLPFKEFMKSYEPADQGGFKDGASPYDTYHCWAAAQYREKVCLPPFLRLACYRRVFNVITCLCLYSWMRRWQAAIGHPPHPPRPSPPALARPLLHPLRKVSENLGRQIERLQDGATRALQPRRSVVHRVEHRTSIQIRLMT
jgi:hypothetical protein